MKQFLHATATLAGLIVGVGIFGVPYVVSRVGLRVGLLWILAVGFLVMVVHLLYGFVVAATPGKHRLPGYIGRVMGKTGKQLVLVTDLVRFWALQLVYLIIGGTFLSLLLQPYLGGDPFIYSLALFSLVATATLFGLRLVGKIEFVLTWVLLGALLFIIWRAAPYVQTVNFGVADLGAAFFSPYGVIMVSLTGAPAIPELWDIVRRRKKVFWASIIVGTLIPIVITALFTWAIVGASGGGTSEDALTGLQGILGPQLIALGALVGFLAIITSYLIVALYMQEMLRYDFLVRRTPAWAFAVLLPLVLFFIGTADFIAVVDIIGSVLFGIEGLLIIALALILMWRRKSGWRSAALIVGVGAAVFLALGVLQKILVALDIGESLW